MRIQTEYDEEGIGIFDYKTIDNSDTIALFEDHVSGLISALDEEGLRPNGNNEVCSEREHWNVDLRLDLTSFYLPGVRVQSQKRQQDSNG
jgi:myosin heavy subunit